MFKTETSVGMLKAIAMIAGLAILLWSLGLPSLRFVEAANVTSFSDTLSDSAPSVVSDHTISFVATNGVASTEFIELTFPGGFSFGTIGDNDLDLSFSDMGEQTLGGGVGEWTVATTATTIRFTSNDAAATTSAGATVSIEIGRNATAGGTGDAQITNPTIGSHEIAIDSGSQDSGITIVAIIDTVAVTAAVDTIFTFAVSGVVGGGTVNGETITGTSSTTTIPFGTLTNGNATTTAQDLSVTTNASNGYVITVQLDQALQSSTGADIDVFEDGSDIDTPIAWDAPAATLDSENTYGHWGFTTDDATTTRSAPDEFDALEFAAASTTPRVVMSHTGPANGAGTGVGVTRVGYKIEISSLQEAGDDYTTTLTYVATPTF